MIDAPFAPANSSDDDTRRNHAEDWYTDSGVNSRTESKRAREELKAWLKAWIKKIAKNLNDTGSVMKENGEIKFADWLVERSKYLRWDGNIKPRSNPRRFLFSLSS